VNHLVISRVILFSLLSSILFSACGPGTPSPTPQVIDIYATAATQPWLSDLYGCAAQESVVLRLSDLQSAEIVLRIGQPADLTTPAFQIDSEDILIVTNRESPVQNLTADEAWKLFAQGQPGVQVWVFAPGDDVRQIFEQEIMQGASTTSLARLAANPQQMSDTLNAEKDTVGILPRHWKAGTVRDVYTIPDVPVLAILGKNPHGAVEGLLACLQK
jgi:hypothetical protein